MPIVALPDGREVEFPDGTPTDVMERAMRDFVGGQPAAAAPVATSPDVSTVPAPSAIGAGLRSVARGALMGFADEAKAGVQSLIGNGTYEENLAAARAQAQADQQAQPVASIAGQLYGGVGGAMAGGAAVPAAAARLVPNALLRAGVAGAASGGVTGFGEGQGGLANRAAEAGTGAMWGAGVGAGVGLAGAALGRVVAPVRPTLTPEAQRLREVAEARNIPLTAGQQTGSRFVQNIEARLAQLPFSSGMATDARLAQKQAFTREVLADAGESGNAVTNDVMDAGRARLGGMFDDLTSRNNMAVTPEVADRLGRIEDNLRLMPREAAEPMRARLEDLHRLVQPDGTLPGTSYRMVDSALGKAIKDTGNGDLRSALTELRETLREGMDASISPADSAAWQQARTQYRALKTAGRAVSGSGADAAEGLISPPALKSALDAVTPRDRRAFDDSGLRDLAKLGQTLRLPPDSGTSGGNFANALLTGSIGGGAGLMAGGPVGAVVGTFALPPTAQAFLNSSFGRRWLTNQLAPNLAGNIASGTPGTAAAVAAAVERNRLLND